jgi:hypothetical protein
MTNAHAFTRPAAVGERQHVLSVDCWCQPDITHVTGRNDAEVADLARQRAQEKHLSLVHSVESERESGMADEETTG